MLLSNEQASIPAPLFVTWFQCLFTFVVCIVLGNIYNSSDFPRIRPNYQQAIAVLPLSLVFVGMITFNNICLQYVAVSFYNVARSLSIVFNVLFTYLLLGKETSLLTGSCLLVVIVGFILGIDGEVDFSLIGTLCGVLSSVFVSLNSIYTSKILPKVNNEKSLLLFYNNVNAFLLFIPLIVIFESHVS
jgi:solute carrier family 35 (GDP-fucose transporter), member C1